MPDIFVITDNNIAFLGSNGDRHDFIFEFTGFLSRFCFVLGRNGKLILFFTGDLPFGRNVFCRGAHMVAMESIEQAIAEHGIQKFHVAHFCAVAQKGCMLRVRHGFLSASHDDGGIAIGNLLQAECDSAQTRAAKLV